MIVMKFGGTSVGNAQAMLDCYEIIKKYKNYNPVVVLSAASGTTDKLIELIKSAANNSLDNSLEKIEDIRLRHISIAEEAIKSDLIREETIEKIDFLMMELTRLAEGVNLLSECTPKSLDAAASSGELLSTTLFTAICNDHSLGAELADARQFMKTNNNFLQAQVDTDLLKKLANDLLLSNLHSGKIVITQGFIGSDEQDRTTTLGRGGSDYSAALIGAALSAEEIQIWTDVSGVMTADPKIVPGAVTNTHLTIEEVRELSFFGAKVLHPEAIKPAIDAKIPVRVLNTKEPENEGTLILHKCVFDKPMIRTFVLKENVYILSRTLTHKEDGFKILSETISKFEAEHIKVYASAAANTKTLIIVEKLINMELITHFNSEKCSLIALCGVNLANASKERSSILNKITETLDGISYSALLFGVNTNSVVITMEPEDAKNAIILLHNALH